MKKNRRLMCIQYRNDDDVRLLQSHLDELGVPHVEIHVYTLTDGTPIWKIWIDRGSNSWETIMNAVNSVHAVKFNFISDGTYIKDAHLYTQLKG